MPPDFNRERVPRIFIFGVDGFLPYSRASFCMDVVAVAMLAVLLLLARSVYVVKRHRDYEGHKRVQFAISIALAAVLVIFEIDTRVFGWDERAFPSPYFARFLFPYLYVHITIATTAAALWYVTLWTALKRFSDTPPRPGTFSRTHKILAYLSVAFMILTALTGWGFYYLAFVAKA